MIPIFKRQNLCKKTVNNRLLFYCVFVLILTASPLISLSLIAQSLVLPTTKYYKESPFSDEETESFSAETSAVSSSLLSSSSAFQLSEKVRFTGGALENTDFQNVRRQHYEELWGTHEFSDEKKMEGWSGNSKLRSKVENGYLHLKINGEQPYISRNFQVPEGSVRIQFRMRTKTPSDCVFRWLSVTSPRYRDDKMVRVKLIHDGQWHDYETELPVLSTLTNLAIQFTASDGEWDFDEFTLWIKRLHPLSVINMKQINDRLEYTVANQSDASVTFEYAGQKETLAAGQKTVLTAVAENHDCLKIYTLALKPDNYPELHYSSCRYDPALDCQWYAMPLGKYYFEVSESGIAARIRYPNNPKPLAMIAPLVRDVSKLQIFAAETRLPLLTKAELDDRNLVAEAHDQFRLVDKTLIFRSTETVLTLRTKENRIQIGIEGEENYEGPVIRVTGNMQNALLAGCEYLSPRDSSGSAIDVVPPYSDRFRPPKYWMTSPLAAVTIIGYERPGIDDLFPSSTIAMTWDDMNIQPTFDIPNQADGTNDIRISLCARNKIDAEIYVSDDTIDKAILWCVNRRGLPDVPPAPRTPAQQKKLNLDAFTDILSGEDGASWGYCAEPDWSRKPYDAIASSIWRLSGEIVLPQNDDWISGGSAIPSDSVHFLNDRLLEWVDSRRKQANKILSEMRADGSFIHQTRFSDFERNSPSSGYNARQALILMRYVRLTGDEAVFRQLEKTLDYLKVFRVPRGGHYWETPQHTPDLLAASHLVNLYVFAYEFSKKAEYLERARYWAIAGLPFVYLWSDRPRMLYATVPMYGASERERPVWFGIAQPWCGCCYAYAIAALSKYDDTLDWRKIARGILHAAESMQFDAGPYMGCLPDGYSLETQEPVSWKVNPAVLVSLRQFFDAANDNYSVVAARNLRVISPFPARLTRDGVMIEGAPLGVGYQILINGSQVVNVQGTGSRDFVPLK
ncbi:MAG: hypothetical protein LBT05_13350 [Planctomycetaceae bacterium]|jgi:hypothetical protein|nr:hypothetical protein [Planctomycetaceae bacterium]